MNLNEKQIEAINIIDGPVMVVAGAGSGKTTVLTNRVANLINNNINPNNILAVTFTNKAAREMKERIKKLTGIKEDMWISTFHSFAARILRRHINRLGYQKDFLIIDDEDQAKIIKQAIDNLNLDKKIYKTKVYYNAISAYKNDNIHFDYIDKFDEILNEYEKLKKKDNLVDFDDLIILLLQLLKEDKEILELYQEQFKYILVDEFQDTNKKQFELLYLLGSKYKNVFIVGDQDQSIYSFRGARYENINNFIEYFNVKNIIKLEENYRSTKNILNTANKLIRNNTDRIEKTLYSKLELGSRIKYTTYNSNLDEANNIAYEIKVLNKQGYNLNDIAILYRSNSLSRNMEEALLKYNIEYQIYGGISFFQRKEIKDILAYLRLIINHNDNFSFKRIINIPKRGIGDKTIEGLELFAFTRNISLLDSLDLYNFSSKLKETLKEFRNNIDDIYHNIENYDITKLVDLVVKTFKYDEYLKEETINPKERLENINELKTVIYNSKMEYPNRSNYEVLYDLLQDLSLKTDLDLKNNPNGVILSTYHQVKGLEFKVVFMIAMENGIFPTLGSFDSTYDLEEERRVCYVGITRCKELLYISNARSRLIYGNYKFYEPSIFIEEMFKQEKTEIKEGNYIGKNVIHNTFGKGKIVSEDSECFTIAFNINYGIKRLKKGHSSYHIEE